MTQLLTRLDLPIGKALNEGIRTISGASNESWKPGGQFIQLRYIGSGWGATVEKPHNPDLVSPSVYALLKCLEQGY